MQNDNLAQYLGGAGNQNTSELLTNAHYDSEVFIWFNWVVLHTCQNLLDAGSPAGDQSRPPRVY